MIYLGRLPRATWSFLAAITWQAVRPGVEHTTFPMAASGGLAHVRVIALRIDPCQMGISFDTRTRDQGARGAWTVDSMPKGAALALNGGQFLGASPWGWFVHEGIEKQPPGTGPLSMALTVDSSDRVALLDAGEIASHRGAVREAIQSYPTLLVAGKLPAALQPGSTAINLEHRDTRLAIGVTSKGAVIIAMTRFGNSGPGGTLPYGPTIPELAELMRQLGAVNAVGLDGGLSSQLAWRDAQGKRTAFTNWRLVPLGIIGTPRKGCAR